MTKSVSLICVLLVGFLIIVIGCGGGSDVDHRTAAEIPGAVGFVRATGKINSSSKGIFHGNNETATHMAEQFSKSIKKLESMLFEGGKENRVISMTDDEFLTFCQQNENKVLFLVHVPQFKRYKGEDRDALLELAWKIALQVTEELHSEQPIELAIGLRGSIFYGGTVIGKSDSNPVYQNEFRVDKETFYPYFVEKQKKTDQKEDENKQTDDNKKPVTQP